MMGKEWNSLKDYFIDELYADVNRWKWGFISSIMISSILTIVSWRYLLIIPIYFVAFLIKMSFVGAREP